MMVKGEKPLNVKNNKLQASTLVFFYNKYNMYLYKIFHILSNYCLK